MTKNEYLSKNEIIKFNPYGIFLGLIIILLVFLSACFDINILEVFVYCFALAYGFSIIKECV